MVTKQDVDTNHTDRNEANETPLETPPSCPFCDSLNTVRNIAGDYSHHCNGCGRRFSWEDIMDRSHADTASGEYLLPIHHHKTNEDIATEAAALTIAELFTDRKETNDPSMDPTSEHFKGDEVAINTLGDPDFWKMQGASPEEAEALCADYGYPVASPKFPPENVSRVLREAFGPDEKKPTEPTQDIATEAAAQTPAELFTDSKPKQKTDAELEAQELIYYNNPKPRRKAPTLKQFKPDRVLLSLPGVRNVWTHRGHLCVAVLNDYRKDFRNSINVPMKLISTMGPTSVLSSEQTICPVAAMKQRFAADAKEARLDDSIYGAFMNTKHSRIIDLLDTYGHDNLPEGLIRDDFDDYDTIQEMIQEDPSFKPDVSYEEITRCDLEDKLDVVPNSSHVEPGFAGFLYKEDYDLERAQKTEHQIDARLRESTQKEFIANQLSW